MHVTVRGNRRERIVRTTADAQTLVNLIHGEQLDLHAWCLMPNHLHLVVDARIERLGKAMAAINGRYAQWFNRKYGLTGRLFESRYKAKPIADEAHLHRSIVYVLMNPVEAKLCRHPSEWPWCNYDEVARDPNLRTSIDEAVRELHDREAGS